MANTNGNGKQATDDHTLGSVFAAFARVGAKLERTRDVDDLLRVVVREVAALVGVERCSIYFRDEQAGLFRGCVGQGGERDMDKYLKRSIAGIPADGVTLELLRTKQPVIVSNARTDPRMIRSSTRFWDIHSVMGVPMIFEDEVIGVIYLDDCERPHVFTEEDAEVATVFARLAAVAVTHAQSTLQLRSKLDSAERQVHALRRAAAVEQRLSDLLLAGSGIGEIVQMLANVLGKPCAIYDAGHTRLALAPAPDDADAMLPRLLEPPAVEDPAVADALAAGDDARPFLVPPLPDAGVMHRHLVAPILVDDELWGRLVVMECRSRFAGGDMLTLRRAATLIALHMRTERSAIEADWNAGASLAAELLDGNADLSMVGRRAERLGVKLEAPHVVVLIGSRCENTVAVSDFRAVASAFHDVAAGLSVHATKVAAGVACVVEVPDGLDERAFGESAKDLLTEVCERLGGAGRIGAGISSVRSGPGSYADVYLEAQQVLDCIRRFGSEQGPAVLSAADLGTGRVFLATSDAEAVRTFADDAFGGLVRDPSKTDLLTTMRCFFDNMASIRRCALELGVHENTIRYRLARIEELTGLSVTHDPDAQLGARLSLLVLMIQGTLGTGDGETARESLRLVGTV
ncbi:MAG TPA: GAF domain-containing protein [Thermoleophilaceae bacterium]|nr:GAF domain-containing protein [Thermoleophilaceae bacterium]